MAPHVDHRRSIEKGCRMISDILIFLTRFLVGGHARWQGSEPEDSPRIYFANHSSHLDTILLWAALPKWLRRTTHPVAAKDYWGSNALKRYIATKVLNAVLLDREGRGDPLEPLRGVLERGESLIIFPEGTRRNALLPGPFKSGLFHLARAFPQVQLVPVYLENLSRAYPKGAIVPAPISCAVRFGPLLERSEDEGKQPFLERAHTAVTALAGEIRNA
jgi:1-acyl-sn-glycerol-3-phosphate acyltransferase